MVPDLSSLIHSAARGSLLERDGSGEWSDPAGITENFVPTPRVALRENPRHGWKNMEKL